MIEKLAVYQVRKEHVDEARRLVLAFVDEVGRKEGGTASYKVWQEAERPTRFVHHMAFRTPSAEQYHQGTAWCKRFVEKLHPLCSQEPEFIGLSPVQPS